MNQETVTFLNTLTTTFYQHEAASFSATRQQPWEGWTHLAPHFSSVLRTACRESSLVQPTISIIDVGAGNGRFFSYLDKQWNQENIALCYHAVDAVEFPDFERCGEESSGQSDDACSQKLSHQILDVVDWLSHGASEPLVGAPANLIVGFGLMHHIPSRALRLLLVKRLCESLAPDGLLVLSLWQFAEVLHRRNKAHATTVQACRDYPELERELEAGDYLLGWQHSTGIYRYCHSFSSEEIGEIVACAQDAGCQLIDRFLADGKEKNLNTYVVFQRTSNTE